MVGMDVTKSCIPQSLIAVCISHQRNTVTSINWTIWERKLRCTLLRLEKAVSKKEIAALSQVPRIQICLQWRGKDHKPLGKGKRATNTFKQQCPFKISVRLSKNKPGCQKREIRSFVVCWSFGHYSHHFVRIEGKVMSTPHGDQCQYFQW